MTAINDLFVEIEQEDVVGASLVLAAKLEYGQLLTENDNLRRIISEMEMQDLQTEEEYKQEMFDRNQLDRIKEYESHVSYP